MCIFRWWIGVARNRNQRNPPLTEKCRSSSSTSRSWGWVWVSCFTFHLWIVHFIVVDLLFSQTSLSSRGWSVWWDGTFKFFRVDQVQTSPIHQTNSQFQLPIQQIIKFSCLSNKNIFVQIRTLQNIFARNNNWSSSNFADPSN